MIKIRAIRPKGEFECEMLFRDTEDLGDEFGVEKLVRISDAQLAIDPGGAKAEFRYQMVKAFEEASREIALKRAFKSVDAYLDAPFRCPAGAYDDPSSYFMACGCLESYARCPYAGPCEEGKKK